MAGEVRDDQNFDTYAQRVAIDHYFHLFARVGVAGYGWYHHSLWVGLAVFVALIVIIAATNMVLLAKIDSFWAIRLNRWVWVIAAAIALATSEDGIGAVS